MKTFILSAILLTFFAGCTEWVELESAGMRPLIFQSEYTNHAWGYNHNGWMMDGSGQVKRFQKTAAWVFPDSLGYVKEADMQKNLVACDSVLEYVSQYEVTRITDKAMTCLDGPLTKPQNLMADAGENIYAIYRYEADRKRYKRVILSMVGDFSQENLAPHTAEVVAWMKKIK